jgi:ABC-type nitrate/sulfonate/bicarbonate transport system substrate-binding protein
MQHDDTRTAKGSNPASVSLRISGPSLQALVTNQIAGYMGSPPFQNEAIKRGCRMLLNSRDIVGPLTFSVCFAMETYGKKRPANVQAIRDAVGKGIALLNSRPEEAAKVLAAASGGRKISIGFWPTRTRLSPMNSSACPSWRSS